MKKEQALRKARVERMAHEKKEKETLSKVRVERKYKKNKK